MPLPPILLAEDDPADLELARETLAGAGVMNGIVAVRDGAEALDYLYRRGGFEGRRGAEPCLLLLDLKMPKVDGLEVLALVRGDHRFRKLPVIVLTGSGLEADRVRAFELGSDGYIVKPLSIARFTDAVDEAGAACEIVVSDA